MNKNANSSYSQMCISKRHKSDIINIIRQPKPVYYLKQYHSLEHIFWAIPPSPTCRIQKFLLSLLPPVIAPLPLSFSVVDPFCSPSGSICVFFTVPMGALEEAGRAMCPCALSAGFFSAISPFAGADSSNTIKLNVKCWCYLVCNEKPMKLI